MTRVPVRLPQWGLTMEEAVVLEWAAQEGEHIEKGAVLLIAETDKATAEVEAPVSGRLVRVVVQPGAAVKQGELLGEIEVP